MPSRERKDKISNMARGKITKKAVQKGRRAAKGKSPEENETYSVEKVVGKR